MLLTKELFYGLDYYKRNVFMGSSDKLYFRIYKIEVAEEIKEESADNQETEPPKTPYLEAVCWEGPFIFDKTPSGVQISYFSLPIRESNSFLCSSYPGLPSNANIFFL